MEEMKKLYLCKTSSGYDDPPYFVSYNLSGEWDGDSPVDYSFLLEMAPKLASRLFSGMKVFSWGIYHLKKEPRRRFLLWDRPAQFYKDPSLEALEQKLFRGERTYDSFFWEGWRNYKGYRCYEKEFYMSSPCYTEQFFMDCLHALPYHTPDVPYSFFLAGYQPKEAQKFSSLADLVADFRGEKHIALIFEGDALDCDMNFSVNPRQYSTADFLRILQETAEKNNINLEVMI